MKTKFLKALKSTRFWAGILIAATLYAQQKGYIDQALVDLITGLLASYIGINTMQKHEDRTAVATDIPTGTVTQSIPTADVPTELQGPPV